MSFYIDKTIYNNNLFIAYVNLFKPNKINIKMSSKMIQNNLKKKEWYTPTYKNGISVLDVIHNKKKHKHHYERMLNAELKYPIFVWKEKQIIFDGNHRLGAAYIQNKKTIKVYEFTTKQMKKFAIVTFKKFTKNDYYKKYNKIKLMKPHEYIELFYKKIIKK